MKTYLFTYSTMCSEFQAQSILNETNAVATWVQPFPNAVLLASDLSVQDLAAVLRERLGTTWFLISEMTSTTVNGLLPANLWEFVNKARIPWQPQSVVAQN